MPKQTRFLPPVRDEADTYGLQPPGNRFAAYDIRLLRDLRQKMETTQQPRSEPKSPTPFGRVWQFRRSLAGELGPVLLQKATATYRGLWALFALRDYYHFQVVVDVSPDLVGTESELQKLFGPHMGSVPNRNERDAPGCVPFLWRERMIFFSFGGQSSAVPFAGYSPLTLIYPGSRPIDDENAAKVFWWNGATKTFDDPTKLAPNHSSTMEAGKVKGLIAAWLPKAIEALGECALASVDLDLIRRFFEQWLRELGTAARAEVETAPPTHSSRLIQVEDEFGALTLPPIFARQLAHIPEEVTDFPIRPSLLTGRDTLIISLEHADKARVKIYGNIKGSQKVKEALAEAEAEGDDLGKVLSGAPRVAYVIIDKLFQTKLTTVFEATASDDAQMSALNRGDGWAALECVGADKSLYMYPFKPQLLHYFTVREIIDSTRLHFTIGAHTASFNLGAIEVSKHYYPADRAFADNAMDLRLFPSFAIDTVEAIEKKFPNEVDRRYYARLRLHPTASKHLHPTETETETSGDIVWLDGKGRKLPAQERYSEGTFDNVNKSLKAPGRQLFWTLSNAHIADGRPESLHFANFGMVLLSLRKLDFGKKQEQFPWKVGLDFGTSNTCVVYSSGHQGEAEVLDLPIFTTCMLTLWKTGARGNSEEGYSAIFDFPYVNLGFNDGLSSDKIGLLNPKSFFPTQLIHDEKRPLPAAASFDLRSGLGFYQNISVTCLVANPVAELLKGFGPFRERTDIVERFVVNRSLKWSDDHSGTGTPTYSNLIWRRVFLQYLRAQIIMAAASQDRYISHLFASYPKAFTNREEQSYKDELKEIWVNTEVDTQSESAAAAAQLGVQNAQVVYLLDIGGGTSDLAIYSDKKLAGECSLKLAGGCVENYFCTSPAFRRLIANYLETRPSIKQMQKHASLKKCLESVESSKEMYMTAFQGILTLVDVGPIMRGVVEHGGSREGAGFVFTNLLLYGGLAYLSGLIQKARHHEAENSAAYEIQWVGNGSSFLKALNFDKQGQDFHRSLCSLFAAASGALSPHSSAPQDPKLIVAKGLLSPPLPPADAKGARVVSQLFSNSLSLAGEKPRWTEAAELTILYCEKQVATIPWDGLKEGPFLSFLEALQTAFPQMGWGGEKQVSPRAISVEKDPQKWAVEYVINRKAEITTQVHDRLRTNHDRWAQTARESPEALQVEPVFVTELAALIEDVRLFCGGAAR